MKPTAKLVLILFGLAYLISPVDVIPDLALPFVGWIDDGLVLWCIYHLIRYGDLPWFMFKRPVKPPSGPKRQKPRQKPGPRACGPKPSAAQSTGGNGDSGEKQSTQAPPSSPWRILGVDESASWSDVQRAYKEKIKQYHPDKLSHLGEEFSSLANEKFLEIQAAYEQVKAEHRKK